jgi:Tol biopolymer transport system component
MKAAATMMAVGAMLTVEQRDAHRTNLDPPSSAVSADGRFVAFTTHSQLAPADANRSSDVYVLDRVLQRVTLESADTGDYTGDTSDPGISADGRLVVFERASIIVLRDRAQDVTTIIGQGHQPAIAENGRLVLFVSGGFGRVSDPDVNGENSDVYSVDLLDGQTQRISIGLHGLDPSIAASAQPSASSDGRLVAFVSRPQAAGSLGGAPKVFVRDTARHVTTLVGSGWDPSLSGDGRFVAFVGLADRMPHIFIADLHTGTTRVITNSRRRGLANGTSAKPAISSTGRFVAFQSEASDLAALEDFNLLWDVFLWDRTSDAITRLSGDHGEVWMEPSSGPSIDAAGSVIAFSSRHPTDASDKQNDFDLYVATMGTLDSEPK